MPGGPFLLRARNSLPAVPAAVRNVAANGTHGLKRARQPLHREAGDPTAATLVLLHGFPSSSAQYDQLMQRLAGRYHLIAPDYPGFGQSPAPGARTTFDRLAEVIDAFTQARDLDRFSLYMFDLGSPVGFRLATRHPERVQHWSSRTATRTRWV